MKFHHAPMPILRLAYATQILIALIAGVQSGVVGTSVGTNSEMTMSDPNAFTYHDYASGTTLVWMSYPAER